MNLNTIILSVALSAAFVFPVAAQHRVPTKTELIAAHAALKRHLKDPYSAKMSDEVIVGEAVCGMYNAKNSYGGYVGQTPFAYALKTGELVIMSRLVGGIAGDDWDNWIARVKRYEHLCKV